MSPKNTKKIFFPSDQKKSHRVGSLNTWVKGRPAPYLLHKYSSLYLMLIQWIIFQRPRSKLYIWNIKGTFCFDENTCKKKVSSAPKAYSLSRDAILTVIIPAPTLLSLFIPRLKKKLSSEVVKRVGVCSEDSPPTIKLRPPNKVPFQRDTNLTKQAKKSPQIN